MAKKSAKSKGFRRQTARKPYLSKKEIIALCVIAAALIVGAILLFRYDDGALKVQDGAVVADGDNWLIVNGAAARGRARYFKLGEIGEIDGYARERANTISDDPNVPRYAFTPEAEGAEISRIEVTASHAAAETMAKYAAAALGDNDQFEVGEVAGANIDNAKWSYFIATRAYYEADEAEDAADTEAAEEAETAEAGETADAHDEDEAGETPEPNRFTKTAYAYSDAAHDSCIVVHVTADAPSADAYPADDVVLAGVEQAFAAVTPEK